MHGGRSSDELGKPFGAEQAILRLQAFRPLQRPMEFDLRSKDRDQALILPRLLNEIPSAAPHRLNRQFNAAPGGHHDDGRLAVDRDNL